MAQNYTQKHKINGQYEEMYPKTVAGQVITDANRQFVSAEEKAGYAGKQDALGFEPENSENKDKPGGYAGLDADGRLDEAQLPETVRGRAKITVGDTPPENAQEGDLWFDTSGQPTSEEMEPSGE